VEHGAHFLSLNYPNPNPPADAPPAGLGPGLGSSSTSPSNAAALRPPTTTTTSSSLSYAAAAAAAVSGAVSLVSAAVSFSASNKTADAAALDAEEATNSLNPNAAPFQPSPDGGDAPAGSRRRRTAQVRGCSLLPLTQHTPIRIVQALIRS
jgi:hypothetical protein